MTVFSFNICDIRKSNEISSYTTNFYYFKFWCSCRWARGLRSGHPEDPRILAVAAGNCLNDISIDF